MNIKVLKTVSEKVKGLIGKDSIDNDEMYLFLDVAPSQEFHMRGVKFPIDIAFLDKEFSILKINSMDKETGKAKAPKGTMYALEARKGFFKDARLKTNDFCKEVHNYITAEEY